MDTLEFLQTILPESGTKYLVLFPAGKDYKIHKPYASLEAMAAAMSEFNRDPQYVGVYHACGAYKQPFVELEEKNAWGKPKRQYRKPNNWANAKAFWLDLDCGQTKFDEGKGYLTQKDAAIAVSAFAKSIGWPQPMLVSSGYGVHAYWPLTQAIKHSSWTKCANLLKACTLKLNLLADPTRSADFASILRPVGSTNRKNAEPKKVRLLRAAELMDPRALFDAIKAYANENDVLTADPLGAVPEHLKAAGLNSDLTAHLAYPQVDIDADMMADACAQVAMVRNTAGDVPYEHWRGVIGLLTHCVNGRDFAHDWSSERGATGHDNTDWKTRYDSWDSGPTKCETLEACSPDGCKGCVHKGKITSPIQLGRVIPITKEETVEVTGEAAQPEVVTVPALPAGYLWNSGVMSRILPDKDGINQIYPFTPHLFYPTTRIRGEDGAYRIGLRMHLHDNRIRDFQMPFEAMASPSDILKSLAKYELMQSNHKDAGNHLTAYLRDSLEALKRRSEEVGTYTTFGWKDDMRGFLLGDRYYTTDGNVRRVLLGGYAAQKAAALVVPKGTLKGYADPLNFVYSRKGMEPMQYAVASCWGSILTPFCEELYHGLLFAITGGDTAKGKSTVAYAAAYAFGDSASLAFKSDDPGTNNAIWATMGTYNNIPIIFDELTKADPEFISTLAYTTSLGEERSRLQSTGSGVKFANKAMWGMSPTITANSDLHGMLADTQANSQAEAVRLIQIRIDTHDIPKLGDTEVAMAIDQMKRNVGVAGDALVRYVVTNSDDVARRVRERVAKLAESLAGSKYRFYRSHAACSLVIVEIAKELEICDFDVAALESYITGLLQHLAREITANNSVTSEDAFSRVVAALMPGIVVTSEYRDSRHVSGVETPRNQIKGQIVGRYVLGTRSATEFAGRMFLCQKAVRAWCLKNRTDFSTIVGHLQEAGALIDDDERVTLTRGTDLPRVQQRCLHVDMTKLEAAAPVLVVNNTTLQKQNGA